MESYDVIIVGLGPAGAATALNLNKLEPETEIKILVQEKAKHPREKICGGGVSAHSQALLTELDFKIRVPHMDIDYVP